MTLKLEHVSPATIRPRQRAWRTHPPDQLALLRGSIARFGIVEPVLVNSRNQVVCGAAIVEAAKAEGIALIPITRVEHLTDEELRAYAIAANRLADLAGYDEELLAEELKELASLLEEPDLSVLGFEQGDLDRLLGLTEAVVDDEDTRKTRPSGGRPEPNCKKCTNF
jgi:ParB-like chromosome segregation protein Spo0J